MSKGGRRLPGYTHMQVQRGHYANQHNPNSVAHRLESNNLSKHKNPNNAEYKGN